MLGFAQSIKDPSHSKELKPCHGIYSPRSQFKTHQNHQAASRQSSYQSHRLDFNPRNPIRYKLDGLRSVLFYEKDLRESRISAACTL
jgi:hypothetical protein